MLLFQFIIKHESFQQKNGKKKLLQIKYFPRHYFTFILIATFTLNCLSWFSKTMDISVELSRDYK
jgi:hypothetical protein